MSLSGFAPAISNLHPLCWSSLSFQLDYTWFCVSQFRAVLLQNVAYGLWSDGQPLAVIAPRLACVRPLFVLLVLIVFCWSSSDHHTFFSFLPDVQHRHGSFNPSAQL
ncbi:hypothetical protein Tco_1179875 [Tanacetum coccineum]